ncbi:uncharacterized protein [Typha latifolia]|uniref:uncharacterized protein n=1 Tax=Typha latifolia TaxID=4733 RepID=UPI003C2FECE0
MDQTRYWMLARRKSSERPFLNPGITRVAVGSSHSESWEEQAFAEDSAGHLGGCIWPPRSYSCSFCRREFRSAQALGGHMNVHRRDRARLKQSSSSPPSDETHDHGVDQNHHVNPCTSQATPYAPQVGSEMYNCNPNPNSICGVVASPLPPPKASASSAKNNWREQHILISPSYSSSVILDIQKESFSSTALSTKNLIPKQILTVPGLRDGRDNNSKIGEVRCRLQRDSGDDDDEMFTCSKRRRIDTILPFYVKPSSSNRQLQEQQQQPPPGVLKLCPSPIEELDLELRLGDPPKVK